MKRIDRLVLSELAGPWAFGVAIFTVLIMAGTWLFKLTDYIVSGVSFAMVTEFTILLLPGVMVKTFSMAVLLSSLLAFGRLSSDSEIVAMKAAGASVGRIMVPVFWFGLSVALLALLVNETLVPAAAFRGTALKSEIEKRLRGGGEPIFRPIHAEGKLRAMIMAKDFNLGERRLKGVTIVVYDKDEKPALLMVADGMEFQNENKWKIQGGARIFPFNGEYISDVKEAWPSQIVEPPKPDDIAAASVRDLDTFSMAQMQQRIAMAKMNPSFDPQQIANLEYGYYNKIALPLAALIFGLVGAPLGIRNHRTGAASGFWISVIIIFGYMMLANLMAVYSQGGVIPAYMASFTPLVIGAAVAAVLIHRRNQ